MPKSNLYIVEASMLPEVFLKVCEAKEYLQTGVADTVAEAVARAGISRSAFYKYKDAVQPFRDLKIVTLSITTEDMGVTVDELRVRVDALPDVIQSEILAVKAV